jgi:hypothetical protein
MKVEFTKTEKKIAYIISCVVIELWAIIAGVIIAAELTRINSPAYHIVLVLTAVSLAKGYYLMRSHYHIKYNNKNEQ